MSLAEKGHRSLPQTLDYLAINDPDRIYASLPVDNEDVAKGFFDVTVRQFSHAVDSLAHWIKRTFGTSDTFETLSYVGCHDLRYPTIILAAAKCGYKLLLISPQNPPEQNIYLFEQTQCRRIFYSPEMQDFVQCLMNATAIPLAPFEIWLESYTEPYPFEKSFEDCKDDPIIVVHSSGSTGPPKPIVWTNGFVAAEDVPVPKIPGRSLAGSRYMLTAESSSFISIFPLFHMAGFEISLVFPLFSKNAPIVMLPSGQRPSPQLLKDMLKTKGDVKVFAVAPMMLEGMARDPEAVELLGRLDLVCFGSAALNPATGNFLSSKGVKLSNVYGQTETSFFPTLEHQDPRDWAWCEFHPCLNLDFEPMIDGKFEMIVKPDAKADKFSAVTNLNDQKNRDYRTKDLFIQHPTKPGLWQFSARTDDLITFSTGFKWFPVPSEVRIMAHPKVRGAVILGQDRPYPVALVEGDDDLTIDELWPIVKQANSHTANAGHLAKNKVVILPPGSVKRSPKGSIVRKRTLAAHANLFESLYEA